jgi:hypothetical protein
MTAGNVKHSDSALVKVVDNGTPPVLMTFLAGPVPPDSAKLAASPFGLAGLAQIDTVQGRAMDVNGDLIPEVPAHFLTSDPTVAEFVRPQSATSSEVEELIRGQASLRGLRPGLVNIYVSTTVFGVAKTDTVAYRIGWPVYVSMLIEEVGGGGMPGRFSRPDLRLGVGALVAWNTRTDVTTLIGGPVFLPEATVVFSNPENIAAGIVGSALWQQSEQIGCLFLNADCANGGNFVVGGGIFTAALLPDPSMPHPAAMRTFAVPGTYEYQNTTHGTRGRIVVVDEQE